MRWLIIILFFCTTFTQAQNIQTLSEVKQKDILQKEESIIYGNFIQRLGFSSGGFPQDIRLINLDTKEIVAFRVKPIFKTTKENSFVYFIKPGNYAILNYWWTQSKWYGGKMFTEPIFRGVDATDDFEKRITSGEIEDDKLQMFTFTIVENSLNYLGTWHFDKGLVFFSEDKDKLDNELIQQYGNLDFSKAKVNLPD